MMSPPMAANDVTPLRFEMMLFAIAHNDAMFALTCRSTHHCRRQHHVRSMHHLPDRANIIQKSVFCRQTKDAFLLAEWEGFEPSRAF